VSSILSVDRLDAGYGTTAVVRNFSIEVNAGEVVALLGPNGAGKTTTLLTIAGLLRPLGGTVRVGGGPVDHGAPHRNARRGLSLVTEDRALFPQLTVRENLRLASRGRADRVTTYFDALDALLDRKAGLLSGGEQQMLAIARALATAPRLLLIDEMSLGLAPVIVERLATIVRRVAEELDIAVVLVEQHVPVALSVADRALVLRHGETVFSGSASDLAGDAELLHRSYFGTPTLAAH
jgi:branched-chain amino acid transport system ATP-binding protein